MTHKAKLAFHTADSIGSHVSRERREIERCDRARSEHEAREREKRDRQQMRPSTPTSSGLRSPERPSSRHVWLATLGLVLTFTGLAIHDRCGAARSLDAC